MTPRPRLRPSLAVAAFTSVVLLAGEGALPVTAARSTTGPFLGTTASCSFGQHCSQMTTRITFPDGVYHATVRAVQTSNALAEYSIAVPAADYPSMQTTVQEDLDTATRAFLGLFVQAAAPTTTSTPTPTPIPPTATPTATPTTIPQPAVAIERIAVVYRAHGQWKTTRVVHPSDRVRIEAYYHATNTGSYIPAGDVHITGHGLTLYRGSMTAATTSDGSAYLYAVNRLQGKGLGGRISIAVTVTLGSATDNRSVQLSVKGAR